MHNATTLILTFAAGLGAGFVIGLGVTANQLRATNDAADREKEVARQIQREQRDRAWRRIRRSHRH